MSEESKNSLFVAGAITTVIMIIVLIFGNVGSGFFRLTMVFIVGIALGTPLAIAGKFIGKWFSKIFMTEYELIFTYVGFVFGSLIGIGIAVVIFSNNLERGFVLNCLRSGETKEICECVYDKLDDNYDDLEIVLYGRPPAEVQSFIIKSTNECRED